MVFVRTVKIHFVICNPVESPNTASLDTSCSFFHIWGFDCKLHHSLGLPQPPNGPFGPSHRVVGVEWLSMAKGNSLLLFLLEERKNKDVFFFPMLLRFSFSVFEE